MQVVCISKKSNSSYKVCCKNLFPTISPAQEKPGPFFTGDETGIFFQVSK